MDIKKISIPKIKRKLEIIELKQKQIKIYNKDKNILKIITVAY